MSLYGATGSLQLALFVGRSGSGKTLGEDSRGTKNKQVECSPGMALRVVVSCRSHYLVLSLFSMDGE